jgi:two-component system, OmpR family, copper resistance phosphate regulon response regulator CusR
LLFCNAIGLLMKIILVEDDVKVASFIRRGLTEHGYSVEVAYNGLDGEKLIRSKDYDVAVFDVLLPGQNGIQLCKNIRELGFNLPVLLLSALGTTDDKVSGLDAGADDYLVKPFEFKELLARLRALSRRGLETTGSGIHKVANLEINTIEKSVKRDGTYVQLTAKEFSLLEFLVRNKGRVISRVEIEEKIWDAAFDRETNIVDVYINFLRKKIDRDFEPKLIHTQIGMGYVLKQKD